MRVLLRNVLQRESLSRSLVDRKDPVGAHTELAVFIRSRERRNRARKALIFAGQVGHSSIVRFTLVDVDDDVSVGRAGVGADPLPVKLLRLVHVSPSIIDQDDSGTGLRSRQKHLLPETLT